MAEQATDTIVRNLISLSSGYGQTLTAWNFGRLSSTGSNVRFLISSRTNSISCRPALDVNCGVHNRRRDPEARPRGSTKATNDLRYAAVTTSFA